jgi:hypothetical protein
MLKTLYSLIQAIESLNDYKFKNASNPVFSRTAAGVTEGVTGEYQNGFSAVQKLIQYNKLILHYFS